MIQRFNPLHHPRNREGEFVKVLSSLRVGDELKVAGGIRVKRREGSYRILPSGPKAEVVDAATPAAAARLALDRSAGSTAPDSIGGSQRTSYSKFRRGESRERAGDPGFANVAPEDDDDLLMRPHQGDPAANAERLADLADEAQDELDRIDRHRSSPDRETGFREFRSPRDEDRADELGDRLEQIQKAQGTLSRQKASYQNREHGLAWAQKPHDERDFSWTNLVKASDADVAGAMATAGTPALWPKLTQKPTASQEEVLRKAKAKTAAALGISNFWGSAT